LRQSQKDVLTGTISIVQSTDQALPANVAENYAAALAVRKVAGCALVDVPA
jgi:hypothetical protein